MDKPTIAALGMCSPVALTEGGKRTKTKRVGIPLFMVIALAIVRHV